MGLYSLYRFGLLSGHYRRATGRLDSMPGAAPGDPVSALPDRQSLAAVLGEAAAGLLAEAEEILSGQVRLFGGPPVPLRLALPGPLADWTAYERGVPPQISDFNSPAGGLPAEARQDAKFLWEPGRFGWAFTLGRAFLLTGDERFARAFWSYMETFLEANPPGRGPHWASAQEVALRLMALAWAAGVFSSPAQPAPGRRARLAAALAAHAARIPPTMVYARAQDNNHLLTEAAGLVTAAAALPAHPEARRWQRLGWQWINRGLESQIAPDGAYTQNSANYHRLMLQAALWAQAVAGRAAACSQEVPFTPAAWRKLAAATRWLLALVDPATGLAPNLGPNDGAYIFPFSACPFQDYRPVLQAASLAFLGRAAFPPGPWDEMCLWMEKGAQAVGEQAIGNQAVRTQGIRAQEGTQAQGADQSQAGPPVGDERTNYEPVKGAASPDELKETPHILRGKDSWAYLRAARFAGRPGHADQLHLDLWWRGLNVAQDAGTYLYNAAPPWDNALARTGVHNTVTLDGLDQMRRAGRFLWLEWAQARAISGERAVDGSWKRLAAEHDGYRRLSARHRREVSVQVEGEDGREHWTVIDRIEATSGRRERVYTARLHWLLPDWPWEMAEVPDRNRVELRLRSPAGGVCLRIAWAAETHEPARCLLARAGQRLFGAGEAGPAFGWVSPTYGLKLPALSLSAQILSRLPITWTSEWRLACTFS